MNNLSFRNFSVFVFLLAFLAKKGPSDSYRPEEKNGTLVVLVTWGDAFSTPATHVYIEAHGFVRKYNSTKSFVLNSSHAGRYEASLPPGVYDVFVSDGISMPACKRVLIKADSTTSWTLHTELDNVYSEK